MCMFVIQTVHVHKRSDVFTLTEIYTGLQNAVCINIR